MQTSDIIVNGGAAKALALGDLQYNSASIANLRASYDRSWGRVKSITRPVLGNHESTGNGYFDYFNGVGREQRAGRRARQGLLQLRRRQLAPDRAELELLARALQRAARRRSSGCAPTSPPIRRTCTLAYWHHPRFSSGHDGDSTFMQHDLEGALRRATPTSCWSGTATTTSASRR